MQILFAFCILCMLRYCNAVTKRLSTKLHFIINPAIKPYRDIFMCRLFCKTFRSLFVFRFVPVLLVLPCPTHPSLSYSSYPVLFVLPCLIHPSLSFHFTLSYSSYTVLLALSCPTHSTLSYSSQTL